MATSIQERSGKFQLRVIHRLLKKPFFATCETRAEVQRVRDQLSAMLASGVVPQELVAGPARGAHDPLIAEVVRVYVKGAPVTESDDALLRVLIHEV